MPVKQAKEKHMTIETHIIDIGQIDVSIHVPIFCIHAPTKRYYDCYLWSLIRVSLRASTVWACLQLLDGRITDQGPAIIISFHTQQTVCVRNRDKQVIEGDPVRSLWAVSLYQIAY